jgi:arsenate reductase
MITIYHNPKCTKSREGLCELEDPFTKQELQEVIQKLGIKPIELVRTKETIWKEQFKGKELTDKEIIEAMLENPKLIERPIVVKGNKAIIARPKERIQEILN